MTMTANMSDDAIFQLLESVGAVRHGHFELTSGRHSDTYVQCALVLQHPLHAEKLGHALAARFQDLAIDVVASPAIGGLVLGQEVGRAIAKRPNASPIRALFVERDATGAMTLRRSFTIEPNERVLVVEDVWTTGGSTLETIRVVEEAGGRVVGAGALVDRSGGRAELPVRTEALVNLSIASFDAQDCPLCRAGQVAYRAGSRFSRAAS